MSDLGGMKDLDELKVDMDSQPTADSGSDKKKKPKMQKSVSITLKIVAVVFILGLASLIFGGDEVEEKTNNNNRTSVTDVEIDSKGVSDEQLALVESAENEDSLNATLNGESFITVQDISTGEVKIGAKGETEVATTKKSAFNQESLLKMPDGTGLDIGANDSPEPQSEVNEGVQSSSPETKKKLFKSTAKNKRESSSSSSRGNQTAKSVAEARSKRIKEIIDGGDELPVYGSSSRDEESESNERTNSRASSFANSDSIFNDDSASRGSSKGKDESEGKAKLTSNVQSENGGRGMYVGEQMVGEFANGLKSTTPSGIVIVNVLTGPLKGAKIIYEPTVAYDTYVFESSTIIWKDYQAPFQSIIITPNETLDMGYRSDVNYHTLYKLGIVFFHGVMTGAAEYVNSIGTTQVVDGEVITTTSFSPQAMLWAAAGGVADNLTDKVAEGLDKPPTVTINAYDNVGILMTANWNAEWAPKITSKTKGIF